MKYNIFGILLFLISLQCSQVNWLNYTTHDKQCYTQGLFMLNQTHIFQSCGLYNKSYFHIMEYNRKQFIFKQIYSTEVPWKYNVFLQGAVIFKNYIYLLTWKKNKVFKLSTSNYSIVDTLMWSRQGWGLTTNETHMFVSDGSDQIFVVDQNFSILAQKSIKTQMERKLYKINQLEFANGYIYANVYFEDQIYAIDFQNSIVQSQYDMYNIVNTEWQKHILLTQQVLNGIVYDYQEQIFIITGKQWQNFYKVKLYQKNQMKFIAVLFMIIFMIII